MAASRDQFLTDIARALRARHGDAEGEALVRPLEPWLDVRWPFPPGRGFEAPSPRAAVAAAEIAVVEAFPDRAGDLLVPLARVAAAAVLAEAVTWESVTTSRADPQPFRRVDAEKAFENVEEGFQRAEDDGRRALLDSVGAERAASLIRRRVRLRAGTLDGGRILLTLMTWGSADIPASAHWLEMVTLDGATPDDPPGDFLVSWMPSTHRAVVDEAIARSAQHAWCEDAAARWHVQAWRPGWIR